MRYTMVYGGNKKKFSVNSIIDFQFQLNFDSIWFDWNKERKKIDHNWLRGWWWWWWSQSVTQTNTIHTMTHLYRLIRSDVWFSFSLINVFFMMTMMMMINLWYDHQHLQLKMWKKTGDWKSQPDSQPQKKTYIHTHTIVKMKRKNEFQSTQQKKNIYDNGKICNQDPNYNDDDDDDIVFYY